MAKVDAVEIPDCYNCVRRLLWQVSKAAYDLHSIEAGLGLIYSVAKADANPARGNNVASILFYTLHLVKRLF